jgi:hypothetical protein
MITNVFDEIKLIRRIKGGYWLKTKHKGWINIELYKAYLGYAFDPVVLKEEKYE